MRWLPALALAVLMAGCSGQRAVSSGEPGGVPAEATLPPQPQRLVDMSGQLGPLPARTGSGLTVPANATHLVVELKIILGASAGTRLTGLAGCERSFPVTKAGDSLQYECDAKPGDASIWLQQDAGRLEFALTVTAQPTA